MPHDMFGDLLVVLTLIGVRMLFLMDCIITAISSDDEKMAPENNNTHALNTKMVDKVVGEKHGILSNDSYYHSNR
jgi:hypothetical protein